MLNAWRERRDRKKAEAEARHLAGEARRILKKKSYRIPEAVSVEIEAAITDVDHALSAGDADRTRAALNKLDEKMDEHLSFARKSSVREYAESIGVAVAIALLLRAFVVEAFQIPSGSMIPTLEIGDHIFVSKFSYGIGIPFTNKKLLRFGLPKRGDIVVFKQPQDQSIDYIKRVVALPGEKVEIRQNEIFIDGRPMSREVAQAAYTYEEGPKFEGISRAREAELWVENLDGRLHQAIHDPGMPRNWTPPEHFGWKDGRVPDGHVFVMGDNRDNSNDSRSWGTVPEELIKGRALIVWWSRGPTAGGMSFSGLQEWFGAIRWRRFFQLVR